MTTTELTEEIARLSAAVTPTSCELLSSVEAPAHLTLVALLPAEIVAQLQPILDDLRKIDPSLLLNPVDLLHLTVFHCSVTYKPELIMQTVKEVMAGKELSFTLHGLTAMNTAFAVCAFPDNDSLFTLRQALFGATNLGSPPNGYRGHMAWATLGRYSEMPKPEVLTYLNSYGKKVFGEIVVDELVLYKSKSKDLSSSKEVARLSF